METVTSFWNFSLVPGNYPVLLLALLILVTVYSRVRGLKHTRFVCVGEEKRGKKALKRGEMRESVCVCVCERERERERERELLRVETA